VASYELTDEEVSLLGEVINQHLAEMRYELADTDNARFRAELRERYDRIQAAAARLGIVPPSG
jgi:hypothetical protein